MKNQIETTAKTNKNLLLNGLVIIARSGDGYVNLTQLCKAGKKEFSHWKENKNSKEFMCVLSSSIGIPVDELIRYETGSIQNRASWGHPQVAINIAQWISPQFDVQVSNWIFETYTELNKLQSSINNLQTQNCNLKNQINNQDMTLKISLENGETMNIGIRSDGYINATELCKAAEKNIMIIRD